MPLVEVSPGKYRDEIRTAFLLDIAPQQFSELGKMLKDQTLNEILLNSLYGKFTGKEPLMPEKKKQTPTECLREEIKGLKELLRLRDDRISSQNNELAEVRAQLILHDRYLKVLERI